MCAKNLRRTWVAAFTAALLHGCSHRPLSTSDDAHGLRKDADGSVSALRADPAAVVHADDPEAMPVGGPDAVHEAGLQILPVGFSIGPEWVAIHVLIQGPSESAETLAVALASKVRSLPEEWVDIIGPVAPLSFRRPDPAVRIQFIDPKNTSAYQTVGNSVRFVYWLTSDVDEPPVEGSYTYRLRCDAPYSELLAEYGLLEQVNVDSGEYRSTVQKNLRR